MRMQMQMQRFFGGRLGLWLTITHVFGVVGGLGRFEVSRGLAGSQKLGADEEVVVGNGGLSR